MLSVDAAHARGSEPLDDGTYLAVTVLNRGDLGVMVWAGRLHRAAADSTAMDISPRDYVQREAVSFMLWVDAIDYFEGRPYADLLRRIVSESGRRQGVR